MPGPSPTPTSALIIAGGPPPVSLEAIPAPLGDDSYVIAADGGLDTAESLGIDVDAVIGDFDSVSPAALERARHRQTDIVEHSRDKDETDLELAIAHAQSRGIRDLMIIGAGGGRVDHEVANVELICSSRWKDLTLTAADERGLLVPIFDRRTLPVEPGAIVTLMAIGGRADGVRTRGLRWRLDGQTLMPGSTLGVSNVATSAGPTVSVESGTVLAVLPCEEPL